MTEKLAPRAWEIAWPIVQATAAATVAWVIARYLFDHPQPFFAPIAALVALNTSVGERGLNAIRLVEGVILGIVVGEATLALFGAGYGSMALAIFVAAAVARVFTGERIVVAQAAVGAILTVSVSDPEAGIDRLVDALIGAGVALAFSQLLFSPEPVALLRRVESTMLERMAVGMDHAARALESPSGTALAEEAIAELRELAPQVAELRRVRRASSGVARRTLAWRSQRELIVRENENADHLDLLAASCLQLARVTSVLEAAERAVVAAPVRELAEILAALEAELGEHETRQRAADRALEVANTVATVEAEAGSPLAAAVTAVQFAATDLMVFAGVDVEHAIEAVREGILERRVRPPAQAPHGLRGRLKALLRL